METPGTVRVSPVVVKILGREMRFANANAEYFYSSHKPFLRKDTFKSLRLFRTAVPPPPEAHLSTHVRRLLSVTPVVGGL